MKEELVKILTDNKVEKAKSQEILKTMSTLVDKAKTWEEFGKIVVTSEDDVESMKAAKANRLSIKSERVETEKFIKAARTIVQARMAEDKAEDTAWLKISQLTEAKAKAIEAHLEEQEKFAEKAQEARAKKVYEERYAKLAEVCDDPDIDPSDYPLAEMTDKAFEAIYNGFVAAKKQKIEREAENERLRAEAEALELQRQEEEAEKLAKRNALQKERYDLLSPYAQHGPTVDMLSLAEIEEEYFNQVLTKKKESFAVWKEEQDKKEAERVAQRKELEATRAKQIALEKEIEEKKKAEELERLKKEAAEKLEAQRIADLAKSTDKNRLTVWLNEFTLPDFNDDGLSEATLAVVKDIKTKFAGFEKWADGEIKKL